MRGTDAGALDVSLTELEALCRKAARGGGYPWGLAEEAGRAVRELAAVGQDGPGALLVLLNASGGDVGARLPARDGDDRSTGREGWACPVATAVALSDRAHRLDAPVIVARVLAPVLMEPTLRHASLGLDGECPALDPVPHDVRIVRIAGEGWASPAVGRPRVTVDAWRALESWAQRTYVPASDASRTGAGQDD